MSTEEILSAWEARFSAPAGPVRNFASTPMAPPPADPPAKKPQEFRPRPVAAAQPKATKSAQQARERKRRQCPHESGWYRVRGVMPKIRCKKCREVRNVTPKELEALTPRKPREPIPIPHGTRTGYFRGCRLECCASVESAARAARYLETRK
jgi:hypothetical protein